MASGLKNGIINIDANDFSVNGDLYINYITVIASADDVNCVLSDKHGSVFHQVTDGITDKKYYTANLGGQLVEGLVITTFGNVTRIIIGLARAGD